MNQPIINPPTGLSEQARKKLIALLAPEILKNEAKQATKTA